MAHFKYDTFTTRAEWQHALDTLVAAAAAACQPGGTPAARQAARDDLRAFRNFPCPFDLMRSRALEALNDLSLADIGQALGHLEQVKQQLLDDQQGLNAFTTTQPQQPIQQAQRALTALHEVSSQHPEVAQAVQKLQAALNVAEAGTGQ